MGHKFVDKINDTLKTYAVEISIVIGSWLLFFMGLHWKHRFGYDEAHYVPAAQAFLNQVGSRNLEHPPLAKELIAIGLAALGDNPFGWRIMSTFAGAATMAGMMMWAQTLFKDRIRTIQTGLLSLFCGLILIQSKTAMLDTFMAAFLVFACVYFCKTLQSKTPAEIQKNLLITSVFLGLTTACKWFGLIACAGFLGVSIAFYLIQHWRISFPWIQKSEMPVLHYIPFWKLLVCLIVPAVAVYFATFFPYLLFTDKEYTVLGFIDMQKDMLRHLNAVTKVHGYESHWTTWPFMRKPVCYFFSPKDNATVKAVFCMVNPLIQWGGLVALAVTAFKIPRDKKLSSVLIVGFYLMFYLCWLFMSRRLQFFYYYYPAVLVLILAITDALEKFKKAKWWLVAACGLIFIIYFPIWTGIPVPKRSIHMFLWFRT